MTYAAVGWPGVCLLGGTVSLLLLFWWIPVRHNPH
jgi:hypothetical protein